MSLGWRWLGRRPYTAALTWQRDRREAVIAGRRGEVVALLEHDRVVTAGRRGGGDLDRVRAAGIEVVETERGGLATWHGPGQLVGYLIVDVETRRIGIRRFVHLVEHALVSWVREHGVGAERIEGTPGVFVAGRKLASIGLHFRRGVGMHGFSLNLRNPLGDYALFTACGLDGIGATRMCDHTEIGGPAEVAAELGQRLVRAVDMASGGH